MPTIKNAGAEFASTPALAFFAGVTPGGYFFLWWRWRQALCG
jgi:hypothetical protein